MSFYKIHYGKVSEQPLISLCIQFMYRFCIPNKNSKLTNSVNAWSALETRRHSLPVDLNLHRQDSSAVVLKC